MVKIVGLLIGVLVTLSGIYYFVKEKEDQESKKIYTVVTIAGVLIALAAWFI